jgi:Intracellular proteinase inhibitor
MSFRVLVLLSALLLTAGCQSGGLYRWIPFLGKGKQASSVPADVKTKKDDPYGPVTGPIHYGLEFRVTAPETVRLTDARSIDVRIQLINRTKKTVNLLFNDSRRFDLILRDPTGKKLAQWSDDQPVTQQPGYVIVNPKERVEFGGQVSTRDMVAGRPYILEVFIVGYDAIRQSINIVPQR